MSRCTIPSDLWSGGRGVVMASRNSSKPGIPPTSSGGARRAHEARVVKRRVGGGDILDRYGMPPVVAEVVGVRESADPTLDQGTEPDIFCIKGLVHMIPFSIGYSVSFV